MINIGIISIATKERVSYLKDTVGNMVVVQKTGYQTFTQKEIEELTDNKYVKEYNVVSIDVGILIDAKPYVKDDEKYNINLKNIREAVIIEAKENCCIIGLTNSNYYSLFACSGFNLLEGTHITIENKDDKVAIISKQLAEKNNLRIGDTINVSNAYSGKTPLKITGIYEYVGDVIQQPSWLCYEIENTIFVPGDMLRSIIYPAQSTQLILYLQDSSLIEEYIQETNKTTDEENIGLQRSLNYTWDEEWFNTVSNPVQNVSNMTLWMVIIVAIGTYIIILLISILILIGKKREIIVYLSLGESKIKLIAQIIMEQMVIILISLVIACGISFFINQNIGKAFIGTSASEVNEQIQDNRDILIRNDEFYFIQNELLKFRPTFFYVQGNIDTSNSIDTLIRYVFLGAIILIFSLMCQILLFLHKNSVNNCCKRLIGDKMSIVYNIKENVLLFLVYFVATLLLLSSYCVRSSAITSIKDMQKDIGASVLITKKYSSVSHNLETDLFSYDIGKEIAKLPQVKQKKYYSRVHSIGIDIDSSLSIEGNQVISSLNNIFYVEGITNTNELVDFKQEKLKLSKGRFLTAEDEDRPYAIINDLIALNNKLGIGDKFSLQSELNEKVKVELEIVGIFKIVDPFLLETIGFNYYSIYTSIGVAAELNNGRIMEATYFLNNFNDVKSFIDEASIISENHAADLKFYKQTSDYFSASRSTNSLINLCNVILISSILMVALILCFLGVYIFPKIGIWLSIGKSRFKIILQMTLELIIPMLLAITTGIIASKALILPYLEKGSLANLGINAISLGNSILLMYCAGLFLSILSILVPSINVLRYNPKEISDMYELYKVLF